MKRNVNWVLIILGPTATGKSKIAIEVAKKLKGEIVSADSRQIYKYMSIGTAKPTVEEISDIPYHLINIALPDEVFSAAQWSRLAREKIKDILGRKKFPIVCGGSGLYIRALTEGFFEGPGADENIRERLKKEAKEKGLETLFQCLLKIDPHTAIKISPTDEIRIVRALEIYELTGKPKSVLEKEGVYPEREFEFLKVGINMERAKLYERINQRVNEMLKRGLMEEVKKLKEMSYTPDLVSLDIFGYKDLFQYLEGKVDLTKAIDNFKRKTRNYAKRQLTWFRKEKDIVWVDGEDCKEAVEKVVNLVGEK